MVYPDTRDWFSDKKKKTKDHEDVLFKTGFIQGKPSECGMD